MIFLVLIGVWAAYFLLYWVRRRDHLATARTVDQFSASMRVLELRAPLALHEPAPRSYSASPTRATPIQAPAPAPAPAARRTGPAQVRVTPMQPSRRVRGLTLVLGLVATLATAPLSALGYLLWPLAAAPAAVAVGGLLWLRSGVSSQTRARRLALEARRGLRERPSSSVEVVNVPAASVEPVAPTTHDDPAEPSAEQVADRSAPYDAAVAASAGPLGLFVDEDDIPLTWDPIPVPRPTYAMKAKAERPAPPPAETTPAPAPRAVGEDTAYQAPERRAAGA